MRHAGERTRTGCEAVIALFYMGAAALLDLPLSLARGETPQELVIRARERSEPIASSLELFVTAFYRARYSDEDIQPQQGTSFLEQVFWFCQALEPHLHNA
ncbi:MAG: DUF4129 domain-containing protein [Caldiserica bacterium]|nr:DUF4129 domain-containing protein [Caldisericota bacterium]